MQGSTVQLVACKIRFTALDCTVKMFWHDQLQITVFDGTLCHRSWFKFLFYGRFWFLCPWYLSYVVISSNTRCVFVFICALLCTVCEWSFEETDNIELLIFLFLIFCLSCHFFSTMRMSVINQKHVPRNKWRTDEKWLLCVQVASDYIH